ncbi:two-component system sensor histidine kinase NtrB [Rariglobus hedericola]|uniref:histidine kinase n=1 Tax=Rariglobus hedericola TaxID=2597822 RepID=A0A556QPM8_9BACT|nr:ATP-binding protein [Rariglobus hedericola]TSJ78587.1 hypothetical protein FPL22_04605 [Rariglobus hedericola]
MSSTPPFPNESLATLAGGVAHEFNTVLSIVLGYTQLIPDLVANPVRLHEALNLITQAASRGADVVYQLQLFARTQECPRSAQDLHTLIRDSVAHSTRQWPVTIQVRVELCDERVILPLNAAQFILALQHLLQNARVALPADRGTITLRTTVHAEASPPLLCLSVEDNGSGMDTAMRTRGPEPFFTGHPATGMRGLGLSVVHGIVQAHAGRLEIDSAPQCGTRIKIWLPWTCSDPEHASFMPETTEEHTRRQLADARAYTDVNTA